MKLAFTQLEIQRMRGLHSPIKIDELSPCINVIYGPNGSGKSTTAYALQAVLWPTQSPARTVLRSEINYDNRLFRANVEEKTRVITVGGATADLPHIAGDAEAKRYMLSLDQLIGADSPEFAALIQREAVGGFNFEAAKTAVVEIDKRSGKSQNRDALKSSRTAYRAAIADNQSLDREQAGMNDLKARISGAVEAAKRAADIEREEKRRAAEGQFRSAEERLCTFDDGVDRLIGDDVKTIEGLKHEAAQQWENVRVNWRRVTTANRGLVELGLPEGGRSREELHRLRAKVDELGRATDRAAQKTEAYEGAVAREKSERQKLGSGVTTERLAKIGPADLGKIAKFAEDSEKLRATEIAAGYLREIVVSTGTITDNADVLTIAARYLQDWLMSPVLASGTSEYEDLPRAHADSETKRIQKSAAALTVIAVILTLAMGVTSSSIWLLFLIPTAVSLYFAWRRNSKSSTPTDPRVDLLDRFEKVRFEKQTVRKHVPEPIQADAKSVGEALCKLICAKAWIDADTKTRTTYNGMLDVEPYSKIEEKKKQIKSDRDKLRDYYGAVPAEAASDEAVLYNFTVSLTGWQNAHSKLEQIEAEWQETKSQRDTLLVEINQLLGTSVLCATDHAGVSAALHTAERLQAEYTAYQRDRVDARRIMRDELIPRLRRNKAAQSVIYARVGLPYGDEAGLRRLHAQLPQWQEAAREVMISKGSVRSASTDCQPERWSQFDDIDLTVQRRQAFEEAATREELATQLGQISERIRAASSAHEIEAALVQISELSCAMEGFRKCEIGRTVSGSLADWLATESREALLPKVFHRARELFSGITRGQFRLEFDPVNNPPRFTAIDTQQGDLRQLSELSSGTRVQLLIAVRLAFVEMQELGARLPLLLDETLANSDARRAQAILTAVIEICQTGRQVFYFTARPEEAELWHEAAMAAGIDFKAILLAEIVDDGATRRPAPGQPTVALPAPPMPGSLNHVEYAEILNVPGIDLFNGSSASTHLWYYVDDANDLYNVLKAGYERWGPLSEAGARGGSTPTSQPQIDRCRLLASITDQILQAARVGRCRRVDASVLRQSDAISPAFFDRVAALSAAESGSAKQIIAALRAGQVPGFRRGSVDVLESFFIEHEYLATKEPSSLTDIALDAQRACAEHVATGLICLPDIERIANGIVLPEATDGA